VSKLLLARGASPAITDATGMTPYEAAKRGNHSSCKKLLRNTKTARHSGPALSRSAASESVDSESVSDSSKSASGRNRHNSNFARSHERATVSDSAMSANGREFDRDDNDKISAWDASSLPGEGKHMPPTYPAGKRGKSKSASGCVVQ
jgi:hypothetical protein